VLHEVLLFPFGRDPCRRTPIEALDLLSPDALADAHRDADVAAARSAHR